MNIVFATCNAQPDISASDAQLAAALKARGAHVTGAPWNSAIAPFLASDCVIIRTTWDYFEHYEAFVEWLDTLEANHVNVLNSVQTLRWNIHKSYLFDLQDAGAPTLPMASVSSDVEDILQVVNQNGWNRPVLKCLVSGTARGLSLFDPSSPASIEQALEVARPWSRYGLIVQPFMPEIKSGGELSLVHVNGEFSHAVCKTPKENEFRIQSEFGGTYQRVEPAASVKEAAAHCLEVASQFIDRTPLYARVDGLIVGGEFRLMELELSEPELMFNLASESAQVCAAAIEKNMR